MKTLSPLTTGGFCLSGVKYITNKKCDAYASQLDFEVVYINHPLSIDYGRLFVVALPSMSFLS
jgi:hypothetical protein